MWKTEPEGLEIIVNNYKLKTPETVTSWVNYDLPLYANDQEKFLFRSWSDGNINRSRTLNIISSAVPYNVTALFCLDLESMCTSHNDCCSQYCNGSICRTSIITERPSLCSVSRPTASPTLAPVEGFTSLTARPTIKPTLSSPTVAPTRPSSKTPPLEIDIDNPLEDEVSDVSIEYNEGKEINNLDSKASSLHSNSLTIEMSTRNIWLISLLVILIIISLVFWYWCKRRQANKDLNCVASVLDSLHGNSSHDQEEGDGQSTFVVDIDGYCTSLKEVRTGSTHCSKQTQKNFVSPDKTESRNDQWNNLGGDVFVQMANLFSGRRQEHDLAPVVNNNCFLDSDLENHPY
jgi:hypothetical protein